jgi:hypothetical protein
MASPVVVDGRLTREKLEELLSLAAEHPELDFKAGLDLTDAPHRLGLVKDIIALANTGTGGYIIVGANDDGTAARDQQPVNPKRFDSADLAQIVSRHVVAAPIVAAQTHEMDGWTLVLIHVAPSANNLPCIVSTSGEYDRGDGRMKTVLQEGVLYVREGTHTVTATDAHWAQLLSRYRAAVIADSREGIDALIRKVVEGMGENVGGQRLSPLALEMDDETFVDAVEPYLDTPEGERRLRRFVRSVRADIGVGNPSEEARSNALNKLAAVAIQAVLGNARDSFETVVSTLHEAYEASVEGYEGDYTPAPRAAYWLDVALRLICVGAAALRDEAWWTMVPLVDRRGNWYHPGWIRHALVQASRAGLLSGGTREDALMLVKARALAAAHPALCPDIRAVKEVSAGEEFSRNDVLLNSMCQFDFAWCVVARLLHPKEGDSKLFYPSCAALFQDRTQPIIVRLATSSEVRTAVFPDRTSEDWAGAVKRVLDVAEQQSRHSGGWWQGADYDHRVEAFVATAIES